MHARLIERSGRSSRRFGWRGILRCDCSVLHADRRIGLTFGHLFRAGKFHCVLVLRWSARSRDRRATPYGDLTGSRGEGELRAASALCNRSPDMAFRPCSYGSLQCLYTDGRTQCLIFCAYGVGLTEQTSLLASYCFNCIALFVTMLPSRLRALVA